MNLHDIKQRIDNEFWAIDPSRFQSFKTAVEQLIKADLGFGDTIAIPPKKPKDTKAGIDIDNTDDGTADGQDIEEDGTLQDGIFVLPINGVLMNATGLPDFVCEFLGIADMSDITDDIQEALEDDTVATIVLNFNTPGGEVTGLYELGQVISEAGNVKNVIGYCSSVCASAGYWLASQCNQFYCSPSSIVGSIGCYTSRVDASETLKTQAVKVDFIASSPRKLWGNPMVPMSDDEKAWLTSSIAKLNTQFRNAVLSNRDIKTEYLDAMVFDGQEAVSANLADGNVNNLSALLQEIQTETNS